MYCSGESLFYSHVPPLARASVRAVTQARIAAYALQLALDRHPMVGDSLCRALKEDPFSIAGMVRGIGHTVATVDTTTMLIILGGVAAGVLLLLLLLLACYRRRTTSKATAMNGVNIGDSDSISASGWCYSTQGQVFKSHFLLRRRTKSSNQIRRQHAKLSRREATQAENVSSGAGMHRERNCTVFHVCIFYDSIVQCTKRIATNVPFFMHIILHRYRCTTCRRSRSAPTSKIVYR